MRERSESGDFRAVWRLQTRGQNDHVEVVLEGFLLPFGHRASLVNLTERHYSIFVRSITVSDVPAQNDSFLIDHNLWSACSTETPKERGVIGENHRKI